MARLIDADELIAKLYGPHPQRGSAFQKDSRSADRKLVLKWIEQQIEALAATTVVIAVPKELPRTLGSYVVS